MNLVLCLEISITHHLLSSIFTTSVACAILPFLQAVGNIDSILVLASLMSLPDPLQGVKPLLTDLIHHRNIIFNNIVFMYNAVDKFLCQFVVPGVCIWMVKCKFGPLWVRSLANVLTTLSSGRGILAMAASWVILMRRCISLQIGDCAQRWASSMEIELWTYQ